MNDNFNKETHNRPLVSWSGIPNRAFDLEYSTQLRREMEYLAEQGITPTYVRKDPKYLIPTYKYTKTPELFRLLSIFWETEYKNKNKGSETNG